MNADGLAALFHSLGQVEERAPEEHAYLNEGRGAITWGFGHHAIVKRVEVEVARDVGPGQ